MRRWLPLAAFTAVVLFVLGFVCFGTGDNNSAQHSRPSALNDPFPYNVEVIYKWRSPEDVRHYFEWSKYDSVQAFNGPNKGYNSLIVRHRHLLGLSLRPLGPHEHLVEAVAIYGNKHSRLREEVYWDGKGLLPLKKKLMGYSGRSRYATDLNQLILYIHH